VRLELDHFFCMVDDLVQASRRLEHDGWVLDPGSVHEGQGTRNRRLAWPEQHLELLCVVDHVEARASRLRLDRRAEWASTDASPFGFGLRGALPGVYRDDYWLYEEPGARIWMHHDNECAPARPLVFVLETSDAEMERRRPRSGPPDLLEHLHVGTLSEIRVSGPSPASLPPYAGPPITQTSGPHHLELIVGRHGSAQPITPLLTIRG
jgi:Glyoxalase-like domain